MNLFTETSLISLCMFAICLLPYFSTRLQRYSKLSYLLGTGALAGILLFDLIPDLFEMGGKSSLVGVAIVWLFYSVFHLFHLKHHKDDSETHPHAHHHYHGQTNTFFMVSMIGHCIASGMLLVISDGFVGHLNHTIFLALFAHKAYESLTVASVLLKNRPSLKRFLSSIFAYSMAMPLGVAFTYFFRASVTTNIALVITSLAAGTLAGCLIFDFLIPSLKQMKSRKHAMTWMLLGLGLTQLVMKFI